MSCSTDDGQRVWPATRRGPPTEQLPLFCRHAGCSFAWTTTRSGGHEEGGIEEEELQQQQQQQQPQQRPGLKSEALPRESRFACRRLLRYRHRSSHGQLQPFPPDSRVCSRETSHWAGSREADEADGTISSSSALRQCLVWRSAISATADQIYKSPSDETQTGASVALRPGEGGNGTDGVDDGWSLGAASEYYG